MYGPNGEPLQSVPGMNQQGTWQTQQNINPQQMGVPGIDSNMTGNVGQMGDDGMGMSTAPLSYNQKTSERMRQDEGMYILRGTLFFEARNSHSICKL